MIIKARGYVFGGLSQISWTSNNRYYPETLSGSFVYTLKEEQLVPVDYRKTHGYYHHSSYGPTFGGGHDIYVPDNAHINYGYSNLVHTYGQYSINNYGSASS